MSVGVGLAAMRFKLTRLRKCGQAEFELPSNPIAVRLDFFVNQGHKLFEQIEVLRAGDGMDLLDQLAPPLDSFDESFHTKSCKRSARALKRQEFVDLLGGQLAGPIGIALHPAEELWLRRLIVETPNTAIAVNRLQRGSGARCDG